MNKHITTFLTLSVSASLVFGTVSCNKFLDVVPDDGLPSIETAFSLRSYAIRYLATCYAFIPSDGIMGSDPTMLGSDEYWDLFGRTTTNTSGRVPFTMSYIARGAMSANTVYACDWPSMYEGIRCCDILTENINAVPDMEEEEKAQWIAEVTFLKAYYHFHLVRKWGPVPIIRQSLPIDSSVEEVRVHRNVIDDCFDFILELLDKAMPDLPLTNTSTEEYGRVNQSICAAFKAQVAVYAASPLFNGNEDEATLVDVDGVTRLFPSKTEDEKLERWIYAMNACKDAIEICEKANFSLYTGDDITYRMSDSLKTTLTLRRTLTQRWNSELIWGNTQPNPNLMNIYHRLCMPILDGKTDMLGGYIFVGVPIKIAEQFYTSNGLPISNDLAWESINPMDLRVGDTKNSYYIKEGYTTIKLNFDREPRFYASLGFDGGNWLGQLDNYNDLAPEDLYYVSCRMGGPHAKRGNQTGPVTGYFPKKHFPLAARWTGNNAFVSVSTTWYPWPVIRLTDLYLMYAEAINEAEGPNGDHSADLFEYLDAVRERAGIPDVKTSWDKYSNAPGYYSTQVGMRNIIHAERLNELAFEGKRFWDLRRWKEAPKEYQKGIYGFDIVSSRPEDYYEKKFIYEQKFGIKDYFWPIPTSYIEVNPNLVQNLGW